MRRIRGGYTISLEQCFRLARIWYDGRHRRGWRPRPPAHAQAIFDFLDLTGEFWRIA
jgi:hypothetical protein